MGRDYLIAALRGLRGQRSQSAINLFGLTVGFAACLMLLAYILYESQYDSWVPNSENIYQLQSHFNDPDTGQLTDLQMSSYVAGRALQKDFPEVEARVFALPAAPVVLRAGEALPTEALIYVDGPFFDVMRLPLVRGDVASALARVGAMVVSESEAKRLFGSVDPIGRTVTLSENGRQSDHLVTAVMKDLPRNSHMRINMIVRFDPSAHFAETPQFHTEWGWVAGWNYIALRAGANPEDITSRMEAWERRNVASQQFGDRTINQAETTDWRIMNIQDVHLGRAQTAGMRPGNDRRTLVTFGVIALLILIMACVNYANLATARASQRAREVALRKVLGASRRQLFIQFLAESFIVVTTAMVIALALVELLLPSLSRFLDADLQMGYLEKGGMLPAVLALVFLAGAAGGVYPAIHVSRFRPGEVLKANRSAAETPASGRLRSVLVVGQFAISIALIVCTIVVYRQTLHAQTSDPGFVRGGLAQIDASDASVVAAGEALARELGRVPGVTGVSRTGVGIATNSQITTSVTVPGREDPVPIGSYAIDDAFFRTMKIRVVAGRALNGSQQLDRDPRSAAAEGAEDAALAARGLNVVANEVATLRLGFARPQDAVGANMRMGSANIPITIVGVVQDSRFGSVHEPIEPIIFRIADTGLTTVVARFEGDPRDLRANLQSQWERLFADVPLRVELSEEIIADIYGPEAARTKVFAAFALLAITVACLGLFGLAAFTAERRTKEIGIRKVLGARTSDIVRLLAWQFSKPVIVANLIAWPAAWWVMRDWLNSFDSRIPLSPEPFVLAAVVALVIALATVATHAIRVAQKNPVHALRYE